LCTQAQTGQHASFFNGNSPLHKSGDNDTKIYYYIMQEICEKKKTKKNKNKKKVYQDAIDTSKN
jgi:hypothetical protein